MIGLAALALAVPLHFEAHPGPQARYWASAAAYTVWLSDTAVTMQFPSGGRLQMNLPGSIPHPEQPLPGRSNYYRGSDRSLWRTNVTHYGRIHYRQVFSGIDLAVYGRDGQIEYDWLVSRSADPAQIRFSLSGAESVQLEENGELVLRLPAGEVRHRKPSAYQLRSGSKRSVAVGYAIDRDGRIGLRLGP